MKFITIAILPCGGRPDRVQVHREPTYIHNSVLEVSVYFMRHTLVIAIGRT